MIKTNLFLSLILHMPISKPNPNLIHIITPKHPFKNPSNIPSSNTHLILQILIPNSKSIKNRPKPHKIYTNHIIKKKGHKNKVRYK